jgi:hypothetical protein
MGKCKSGPKAKESEAVVVPGSGRIKKSYA